MAGQNVERREILRALSIAAGAAQFSGFTKWAFAFAPEQEGHAHASATAKRAGPYKPQFFTPEEYEIVTSLSEIIIPSDGTPGAREAGVAEFIDFIVTSDPSLQYRFRYGVSWIAAHARHLHNRPYRDLTPEQHIAMLTTLAYRDRYRTGEEDGRAFFALIREYTMIGFYTSRVGMEELQYPGLQQYWREVPGCTHPDDPAHKNLPRPRT